MSEFLHGVETVVVENGSVPVKEVKSSIIGLVGTAPKGATNVMKVISSKGQAVEIFGEPLPGYTIPKALEAIFAQGSSRVIVINVFDPDTDVAAVTSESHVTAAGKVESTYAPVPGTVVVKNSAGDTTYVEGTDYTVDQYGVVTILNFDDIPNGTTIKLTYDRLDTAEIEDADIIGGTSPRTGLELFDEAFTTIGYSPKILICPTYCENAGVAAALIAKAAYLGAVCVIDAPKDTTVAEAIAGRGLGSDIAGFNTASKECIAVYPYVYAFDKATNADELRPYSPFFAGVLSKVDRTEGYYTSPSNHEILGITGIERPLTAIIDDENSEVNQLNEVGIVTIFASFGTGYKVWGNRNCQFPGSSAPTGFIPVHRTRVILDESVRLAAMQFVDKPITKALIDSIRATANAFIRTLIGRGALVDGFCIYNPADNPPEEIAAGHITFETTYMPPTPAEKITFKSFLDINLLKALNQ